MAKADVSHLGRQAAVELASHDIRVNIIAPVSFVTDIGGGAMRDKAVQDMFGRQTLLGRCAETSEIAGAALLLGSDASSWITGAELVLDGGGTLTGRLNEQLRRNLSRFEGWVFQLPSRNTRS